MEKLNALLEQLQSYGSVVVALSGGVDSSVLTKAAALALGDRAAAMTAVSALLPEREMNDACRIAAMAGIHHEVVNTHDLDVPDLVQNTRERCYFCKRSRFQQMCDWAVKNNYAYVADGSNLDDKADYRPGMRAIAELSPQVVSPFVVCGWTKQDIRQQAREWGLPVWNKPSAACLASRLEYGIPLTAARLQQVEKAEQAVRHILQGQVRVRHHGQLARIEVMPEELETFWQHRQELTEAVKKQGFTYVTLDLEGYRMGSQNESLEDVPVHVFPVVD